MKLVNCFATMLLSALAMDLLYLYYAGGWTDPNMLILVSEIVILYAIALFGLLLTIVNMKSWAKDKLG